MSEIIFKLDYKQPVHVTDFCEGLSAFADEYKRIASTEEDRQAADVELYIESITKGSIVTKLVELAPFAMVAIENINTLADFIKNFKEAINWLKTSDGKKPAYTAEQLESIAKIMKPVTNDTGAELNVYGDIHFHGTVNLTINNGDARSIRNAANMELQDMGKPKFDLKEKVVLKWYQARFDTKSKAGDRSIIDSIFKDSVKTLFVNEGVKAKMLSGSENPFLSQYIVDVMVELVQDRPTKYRILDCYGRL